MPVLKINVSLIKIMQKNYCGKIFSNILLTHPFIYIIYIHNMSALACPVLDTGLFPPRIKYGVNSIRNDHIAGVITKASDINQLIPTYHITIIVKYCLPAGRRFDS